MTKFQLVFKGDLDNRSKFIYIANDVASILELQVEFVGTFFSSGQEATLFESSDFKVVRDKLEALENLGIYCDIKPYETKADTPTSTRDIHTFDTYSELDTDALNHEQEELNVESAEGLSLVSKDDHVLLSKSKKQNLEQPNISIEDLRFNEFDADFDKYKN